MPEFDGSDGGSTTAAMIEGSRGNSLHEVVEDDGVHPPVPSEEQGRLGSLEPWWSTRVGGRRWKKRQKGRESWQHEEGEDELGFARPRGGD
jgi:hypothetical protein